MPCIYTGDERGAAFDPYATPVPLPDRDPHRLQAWYSELLAIRRRHTAFRTATARRIAVGAPALYAYRRESLNERLTVIINFSSDAHATDLEIDPGVDLVTGEHVGPGRVRFAPWQVRILAAHPRAAT
jgi:glycosidase